MYQHTQFGGLISSAFAAALVLELIIGFVLPPVLLLIPLLLFVWLLFFNLTVRVNGEFVRLRFGVGLIRKQFRLDDIQSVQPVRNAWWQGWGIHLTAGGWLFNVSGKEAVQLEMKDGRRYRIGTDEPEKLAEAIRVRLAA